MRFVSRAVCFRLAATLIALLVAAIPHLYAQDWKAETAYELPTIDLSGFLADHLGVAGVEDHNVNLGGIGSDLWHGPGDGPGVYWMITDRGPNGEDPRTFPVEEFTPFILKVRTGSSGIEILQAIPITWGDAAPPAAVTGIPNLNNISGPPALNELFYNCFGVFDEEDNPNGMELDPNPNGLDTEGLVRTKDGYFWVVEEYSPSILKIAPNGKVVKRFFPIGLLPYFADSPDYTTSAALPEIYGLRRRLNRGFEGITLSPDGKTLYIALQSPFLTPTTNNGRDSRNTRILAFDIQTEQVIGEYVYRFDPFGEFNVANQPDPPFAPNRARDMKLSALAMLDQHRMLVLERTDFIAKIFLVDLRQATNILGTAWDNPAAATAASLERAALDADGALEAAGITPLPKEFVVTLDSTVPIHGQAIPQKIEGMTVLDGETIAIANDNDFGVGVVQPLFTVVGDSCTLNDTGLKSSIVVIHLEEELK